MKNLIVITICTLGNLLLWSSCQNNVNKETEWSIMTELQVKTAPSSISITTSVPIESINKELKRMGKETEVISPLEAKVELDVRSDYDVSQNLAKDDLDVDILLSMKPGRLQIMKSNNTSASPDVVEAGQKLVRKEINRLKNEMNSKRYPLTKEEIERLRSGASKEVVFEKPIPFNCFGFNLHDIAIEITSSPGKTWIE